MQNFSLFQGSDYVSDAPSKLNDNFKSVASDFKGASFPSVDLFEGMRCYRSDEGKMYRLSADLVTWVLEYTFVGDGISVSSATNATNAINATNAGNVTGVVALTNGGTGATNAPEALANLGITFSNVDLEAGTSELATGALYFVYE